MRALLVSTALALLLLASPLLAGPYGPSGETELVALPGAAAGDPVAVTVEQSGPVRTVISYSIGAYEKTPYTIGGETYYEITLPDEAVQLAKGEPALPSLRRSIIIPADAEMGVTVLSADYVDIENVLVAPSKGNLLRTVLPSDVPFEFGPAYSLDRFAPADLAALGEPYILRDHRGLVVEVNPIQYNPATKILRIYTSVSIEIRVTGPGRINVLDSPGMARRPVADFEFTYRRHFINFDAFVGKYTPVAEAGDMLIITYGQFADDMQPLVDWKTKKGMKTTMVNVAAIGNNAASIKNFVQAFYDSTNLAFLLLVGDAAQVASPSASGGESDPSYAKLAGGDSYPEILVGRFSAETDAQVQTQVQRTLMYEMNPAGADMYVQATGIASSEGPGHFGEYDYQHMNLIRNDLLAYNYTSVDQIYDPGASASAVATALNAGRGVVNYVGHGSTTAWSTTGFSNSNVNSLVNDNLLPVIFSVACVNGDFGGTTCFGEAWLRATHNGNPSGALAAYMSSINQSWNPPMDGQDEINDLLVAEAKLTVGGLCFNGSCKMIDLNGADGIEIYDTWHIFGDPSVMLRTLAPTALAVSHSDVIMVGWSSMAVTVAGVSGALCALTYNGQIYATAYTDAGGNASLALPPELPIGNDMTLTVTAHNRIPYEVELTVITPDGPYCLYDTNTLTEVSGNGNGVVDGGESFTMGVQIKNVGPDAAYNVEASLTTSDTYVTITDGVESYGTIAGDNGTGYVADGYGFSLDAGTPDGHNVVFTLAVTGTNRETWTGNFTVKVHAPEVGFGQVAINDVSGNSNGILDPGETVDLTVTLTNAGTGEAFGVVADLGVSDSYVTVVDGGGTYGWLDSLVGVASNGGDVYTVSASSSCPMGYGVPVSLSVTGANGYTAVLSFTLIVGDRVAFFTDDFSYNQGWTGLGGSGEWTIGAATGGTGSDSYGGPDPSVDHTATSDNGVLGNDLTSGTGGDYAGGLTTTYWVTSPVIDCADYTGVQLRYWHWLGIESPSYDHVYLQVYDGTSWVQLFTNAASTDETSWTESYYDVSAYADENADFQIRFGIGTTDGSWNYCGWNLDDVELKGYNQATGGTAVCVLPETEVSDSLLAGGSSSQGVKVYNTGDGTLRIRFVPMVSWLVCGTEQNYVPAGDSLVFPFTITTEGLAPGDHVGLLHYTTNDNLHASGDITVRLHVHTPGVEFSAGGLTDSLATGDVAEQSIWVRNSGLGVLHITFTESLPWLSCPSGAITVNPSDSAAVAVTFSCGGLAPGAYNGALNYTSDDPAHATGSLPVYLYIYAPAAQLSVAEIAAATSPGDSVEVPFTISNSGAGRLVYNLTCQAFDLPKTASAAAAAETAVLLGYRSAGDDKGDGEQPFYAAGGRSHGGPDTYGYSWIDSDDPGGPAFSWVDISGVGTAVALGDDAMSGALDLGFAFPYYDSSYSAVYIGSNGILTFGSGSTARVNTGLPTAAVPNNLLALWWDDLNPSNGGQIYYYQDASLGRFIVSFVDIRNYLYPSGTGSLNFQAILWANGKITLQYQTMDPGTDAEGLSGATVGMENASGTDGLQVVYNGPYMHDNLAITLSVVRWLWAEPSGGTVEPYGTAEVVVHLDAGELEAGVYTGQVSVTTNDPLLPTATLPVTLTVSSWVCGDVDGDGTGPKVSDLTYLVAFLFRGGPMPPVLAAADCDGQGGDAIAIGDLTYLVAFLFRSGPPPICH
ncbi:MAG TPA: C25 family cysteine peptidase [candidate division Zixibacteria bacterium]|nr:hypothetical protein [candidate division Zixibacteria bacterium]MDD4918633.1 C25 family cysteine peptidase [candidate division Zixibacteria bacterium]HPM38457.1 C25 family cysteine peptidase [candidate division Zixibacteria bacterium]